MSPNSDKLILALDVPNGNEALAWIHRLKDLIPIFKVGLQLFTKEGPDFIRALRERGVEIFLDLKLHDISNTIASAIESIASLDVRFLTIHTFGGPAMLRAAINVCPPNMNLTGVTVLTSLSDTELSEMGIAASASDQALILAQMAKKCGLITFVCSPQEVRLLRNTLGSQATLITPGIRPKGSDSNDQTRSATPKEAILAGADYLVVGRPILKSNDPRKTTQLILDEIEEALQIQLQNKEPQK